MNRYETDFPVKVRLMASAKTELISIILNLEDCFNFSSGISYEFVVNIASTHSHFSIFSNASFDNIPCVATI